MACTGLPMALEQSFDQRSPQRLSVAWAPSTTDSISASSFTRAEMRPSCSPARKTSWPEDDPRSAPRSTSPGFHSATPIFDMTSPTARSAPAIAATTRIVPAVLRGDDVPPRPQVAGGERGGPRRVVGLHGDDGDVEVGGQARRLVQVHGLRPRRERVVRPGDGDAARVDRVDLLGPRVDERHVVTGAREERPDVAAHGARPDEQELLHDRVTSSCGIAARGRRRQVYAGHVGGHGALAPGAGAERASVHIAVWPPSTNRQVPVT